MSIDVIRQKLYVFIRDMNDEHRKVQLYHFKLFAKAKGYNYNDVTYALQQLKKKGVVRYSEYQKSWIAHSV